MLTYDVTLVEEGSLWVRDPIVHTSREGFSCALERPQHPEKILNNLQGPWLDIECYVSISGWWDMHIDERDRGQHASYVKKGFIRWFYLANYGWIHESNLLGFFRKVE